MKNTRKPRLFLDTSALLSGLNSPTGASGFIISAFKAGKIEVIVSPEVIEEAESVIPRKFPLLKEVFIDFLTYRPVLTKKVTRKELANARTFIPTEDAVIFAGALKSKAKFLITLDKKFIDLAAHQTKIMIISPGKFISKYMK